MSKRQHQTIDHRKVELDGVQYVILRESLFEMLCRTAGVRTQATTEGVEPSEADLDTDRALLAEKMIRRRRIAGLSQAELARRAGVRPETLNRIERGRTTPDFATIRKLVLAIGAAECGQNTLSTINQPSKFQGDAK